MYFPGAIISRVNEMKVRVTVGAAATFSTDSLSKIKQIEFTASGATLRGLFRKVRPQISARLMSASVSA